MSDLTSSRKSVATAWHIVRHPLQEDTFGQDGHLPALTHTNCCDYLHYSPNWIQNWSTQVIFRHKRSSLSHDTMASWTLSLVSVVYLIVCVTTNHVSASHDELPDGLLAYDSRQVTLLKQIRAALHAIESRLDEPESGALCREDVGGGQHSCYKLVRAEVTWPQAREYCRSLARSGADLVSIESEIEQIFLVDAILDSQHSCERFHTSGRKDSSDVWMWHSSGRPFSYTAWGPEEPTGNGNICVLWERMQKWSLWDDEDSTIKCCFICEMS